MCLCVFIDDKYLFYAVFICCLSSEDPQSSSQTRCQFSHIENLYACEISCRSLLSLGVKSHSLGILRQRRFVFHLRVKKEDAPS